MCIVSNWRYSLSSKLDNGDTNREIKSYVDGAVHSSEGKDLKVMVLQIREKVFYRTACTGFQVFQSYRIKSLQFSFAKHQRFSV